MHRFHKIVSGLQNSWSSVRDALVTMDPKLRKCNKKDPSSKRNI